MKKEEIGYAKGEICNRNSCTGIIAEHETDDCCSCHINPPCSYCTESREYCPECNWDGREEQVELENKNADYWTAYHQRHDVIEAREKAEQREKDFYKLFNGTNKVEKFDYRSESHTHFSMIKFGVYPESMTSADVQSHVNGSFGGRFERFKDGRFKFIAYTD